MSHTTESPAEGLSDLVIARLRTLIPMAWGSLVVVVAGLIAPHLPPALAGWSVSLLGSPAMVTVVTGLACAAWWWVWNRLAPHVPQWLVVLVLGSVRTPVYPPVDGARLVMVDVTAAEWDDMAALAAALQPGDPARRVLERVLRP